MDEEFYFDFTEYLKMYGLNQTDNMTDFGFIDYMSVHPANHISILVVMCLGLLANSLSTFVWIKDVKAKSGVFFLCCLSIADGLYCFAGILVKCVELSVNGWICNPFIGLSMIFAYASRLLTVAVVAQRWLAVSRPLSLPNLCSFSRQVVILICLLVSLIGLIAMEIYNEVNYCEGLAISLRWMKWTNVYLVIVFTWNAITFVCLVVFNILLFIATCSIRKNLTGSFIGSQQRQLEFHMTIIIFCASALSFADLVSFLLLTLSSLEHIELHESSWKIANDWISLVNSSVNFVFYVLFGRDFRKSLRRMGRHLVARVTRQRRNSSRKSSSQRSTESSVHYMTRGLSSQV